MFSERRSQIVASPFSFNARICDALSDRPLFFLGTLAPFSRASERPIAIACLRLFTVPPLPPLPDLSVPFFFLCMALFTDLPAALPYFDRWISFSNWNVSWLPFLPPLLVRSVGKENELRLKKRPSV